MDPSLLPSAVMMRILQNVPLGQRLRSCALVSRHWAAAAAAATTRIDPKGTGIMHNSDREQLPKWLSRRGSFVTSLVLKAGGGGKKLHALPYPQLRDLDLTGHIVRLTPTAKVKRFGLLHDATKLTCLRLYSCSVAGVDPAAASPGPGPTSTLAALTDLQHLELHFHKPHGGISSSMLSSLLNLTFLSLSDAHGQLQDGAALQHLCCLTRLQCLHLSYLTAAALAALTALQDLTRLTSLQLTHAAFAISPDTIPSITVLTGLQRLQLSFCHHGVAPALLMGLTQLQEVDLWKAHLLGGATGMQVLLSWLPKLQHLTRLCFGGFLFHGPAPEAAAEATAAAALPGSPAAYSAITAGRQLQELTLCCDNIPAAAWAHIFTTERQLPLLSSLSILENKTRQAIWPDVPKPTSQDLRRITRCCSNLQSLQLPYVMECPADISPLLVLLHLQRLTINGLTNVQVLLQLTRLRELHITPWCNLLDTELLRLTVLTGLEVLGFSCTGTLGCNVRVPVSIRSKVSLPVRSSTSCMILHVKHS